MARVATGGGLVALLLTLAATLGCSASGARTASPTAPGGVLSLAAPMGTDPASGPVCTEIVGLDNVTLTFDGGKTLVQGRHGAGKQASRLVSLGAPYTLAALGGGELFISVDGGCHWTSRATTAALGIGEGQGGLAYGWSANDVFAITVDGARTLKVPAGLTHVEADPANKARLTALGWNGTVWSSTDGGDTWQKVGLVSELDQLVVAFAPGEFDHALLGDRRGGPLEMTRDGGRTWTRSTGPALASNLYFEPGGQVAWSFGPAFDRSTDGGASFKRVATPIPSGHGDVILAGAQPDHDVLVFAGDDARPRARFLLRFDLRSLQATKQVLPIDPGQDLPGGEGESDVVSAATFVPGEPSALCLLITRRVGHHGLH